MLLIGGQPQTISLFGLLYVPLGGSLPAAAGMLGPILAFLVAFLAGGMAFFRRSIGRFFYALPQGWRWTVVALGLLAVVGGGTWVWFQS